MTIEYDQLDPNTANFVPLTPLSFLQRTADIYPQREALIYNQRRYTWAQTRNRCTRIASSLAARGIGKNDTVSVFAFNTPEMFESHFSIPMAGAVLNTINTRLDAATVAYIIDHGESRVFICDRQLWPVLEEALQSCELEPEIIIIDDADAARSAGDEEKVGDEVEIELDNAAPVAADAKPGPAEAVSPDPDDPLDRPGSEEYTYPLYFEREQASLRALTEATEEDDEAEPQQTALLAETPAEDPQDPDATMMLKLPLCRTSL